MRKPNVLTVKMFQKNVLFRNFLKLNNQLKNRNFFLTSHRCGHCQRLAPEWKKAASELKGKVKVAALDATAHQAMASRFVNTIIV